MYWFRKKFALGIMDISDDLNVGAMFAG